MVALLYTDAAQDKTFQDLFQNRMEQLCNFQASAIKQYKQSTWIIKTVQKITFINKALKSFHYLAEVKPTRTLHFFLPH